MTVDVGDKQEKEKRLACASLNQTVAALRFFYGETLAVADRIGALYDIERAITGQPAEIRLAARKEHSRPKVGGLLWIGVWSRGRLAWQDIDLS